MEESKLIREITIDKQWCVLRCDNYAHTYAHVKRLVDAAKIDFPGLEDKNIWVKVYNGMRQRSQLAIEFQPIGRIPPDYRAIIDLEPSYN